MKKLISNIMAIFVAITTIIGSNLTASAETKTFTYGDIDGDGDISSNDALLVLRYSTKDEGFNDAQKKSADVDEDDSITANDALSILRAAVGLNTNSLVGKTFEFDVKENTKKSNLTAGLTEEEILKAYVRPYNFDIIKKDMIDYAINTYGLTYDSSLYVWNPDNPNAKKELDAGDACFPFPIQTWSDYNDNSKDNREFTFHVVDNLIRDLELYWWDGWCGGELGGTEHTSFNIVVDYDDANSENFDTDEWCIYIPYDVIGY